MPQQGKPCSFIVRASTLTCKPEFIVFDSARRPWLNLVHSTDIGWDAGIIEISMCATSEILMTCEVSAITFKNLGASGPGSPASPAIGQECMPEDNRWFLNGGVEVMQLRWSARRNVKLFKTSENLKPVATLFTSHEGSAEVCRLDRFDRDSGIADRRGEARCERSDFELMVGGTQCAVDMRSVPSEQTADEAVDVPLFKNASQRDELKLEKKLYGVTGLGGSNEEPDFAFESKSTWFTEEVDVAVSARAPPVAAVALGFVIAYWMNPRRLENVAVQRSLEFLSKNTGPASP